MNPVLLVFGLVFLVRGFFYSSVGQMNESDSSYFLAMVFVVFGVFYYEAVKIVFSTVAFLVGGFL